MKVAVYPGSFNPWHDGHDDVLHQALEVFDKVIIAIGQNAAKPESQEAGFQSAHKAKGHLIRTGRLEITCFTGLLSEYVFRLDECDAIVRGLRNPNDFLSEQAQQYHYEDLGLSVPIFYVISDRNLVHVSSSAIRAIEKARGK